MRTFYEDDVWNLPPCQSSEKVIRTEDDMESSGKGYIWTTDPIARTWHDCSYCRDIIGKGDPYHREAIPMHTHIIVWKACKDCYTP